MVTLAVVHWRFEKTKPRIRCEQELHRILLQSISDPAHVPPHKRQRTSSPPQSNVAARSLSGPAAPGPAASMDAIVEAAGARPRTGASLQQSAQHNPTRSLQPSSMPTSPPPSSYCHKSAPKSCLPKHAYMDSGITAIAFYHLCWQIFPRASIAA